MSEFKLKEVPVDEGIRVRCAHSAYVALTALIAHPKNPNSHPPEQIALLWKIISSTGWRRPIRISTRSGLVTGGHGAMLAARFGGCLGAPVDYQDYDSEEQEIEDLHADNFVAELSFMDPEIVKRNLEELKAANASFDVERLGTLAESLADKIGATLSSLNASMSEKRDGQRETRYPITARMHENYDYMVIITSNITDQMFLRNFLGARKERSRKKNAVGLGHVIEFDRFMQNLRANHHHFLPQQPTEKKKEDAA